MSKSKISLRWNWSKKQSFGGDFDENMTISVLCILLVLLVWMGCGEMTEQEVLDSIAAKVAIATGQECTAPVIPAKDGTTKSSNCNATFEIRTQQSLINQLFAFNAADLPPIKIQSKLCFKMPI